ncbi:HAD-IA family hydrolase [Streptomyces sp. AN091965]|uniref:HAD-IA family hydrolase n=1 Tax=Streptomyces sp. AN091965 TaxID=2927803 RepID=UPI001F60C715|nr:HAD-IA family hydrolase [Streptomyces sp. AN091965]MCI3934376.1 HAD-IA family hydrolase [Streptomyces sp. AN091965]
MEEPIYDAVLCDLDGVLRIWAPDAMPALDRAHGLPEGTLAAAAFAPDRLLPAITGQVSDEQWRAGVAQDLAGVCGSARRADELVDAWARPVGRLDPEMVRLVAAVRRRVPVALVSNATTRLEADLDRLGLSGAVDAVVNTARIGLVKPDPRVLLLAAERVGAAPHRCLFVDDTAEHVAAARQLGMAAHHYTGAARLRTVLTPLLGAEPAAG